MEGMALVVMPFNVTAICFLEIELIRCFSLKERFFYYMTICGKKRITTTSFLTCLIIQDVEAVADYFKHVPRSTREPRYQEQPLGN